MNRAFIGVGSNQGPRLELISQAVRSLTGTDGIQVTQMAMISETEPIGGPLQGSYLNTVVEIDTVLPPIELLRRLQGIERHLGRRPSGQRWGPRPIDLDLLLYSDQVVNEPQLLVPHPRMHERRFVLEPLAQLAPSFIHPLLKQTIAELLEQL